MSALSHATGGTRKPQSRLWYLAAVVAALAGFVFAGLYAYGRLDDVTKGLTQIVVPGEAVLTLEPGHYTIFHESQSVVDGRIFSSTDVAGLAVSVEPVSGAPALALRAPGTASSYEISGRSGRSVLVFDVTEPGEYHVAAGYPDGEKQAQAVLAVGRDAVGKILWLVFSAIGIVFLGVGSAVAIAVMVYRRRRAALATPERSR